MDVAGNRLEERPKLNNMTNSSQMRQKLSLLKRKAAGKTRQLLGRSQSPQMTTLGVGRQWFDLINQVNRRILLHPVERSLFEKNKSSINGNFEISWKIALNTFGAEWAHRAFQDSKDLAALESYYSRHYDAADTWVTNTNKVEHAMKGYTLLYLFELTGKQIYRQGAEKLADALLTSHPRTIDGSLVYDLNTGSILVDTLGMVGPFLARYARIFDVSEALELGVKQFEQFISRNVDDESKLPYHGYFADGPRRLGLHAWGRGTGWYMVGLIDTLAEMPQNHPRRALLRQAFVDAASSLRECQLANGHWNWAVLHRIGPTDSSTTSMLGYSLLRGIEIELLDTSFMAVVDKAIKSLPIVTRADGVLDGSLAECRGLGKYPQNYRPTLWLQGATTAFAALYVNGIDK